MPSRLETDITTFRDTWHVHFAQPLGEIFERKIKNWVDSKIYQIVQKSNPNSMDAKKVFDSEFVKSARDFATFTIKVNCFNLASGAMITQFALLVLGIVKIRGLTIASFLITCLVREAFEQTIAQQNQEEFKTKLSSLWKAIRGKDVSDQRALPRYIFFKEHLNLTALYTIAYDAIQKQEEQKKTTPPNSPIKKS